MVIYGVFKSFIKRNEKTGEALFSFEQRTKSGRHEIKCHGIIQNYWPLSPLLLEIAPPTDPSALVDVVSASFCGKMEDDTINFLTGRFFPGMSEYYAKELISAASPDVFTDDSKIEDIISDATLGKRRTVKEKETLESCLDKIRKQTYFQSLYELISRAGGKYHTASLIFDKFGMNAIDKIKKDPYILSFFEMDFTLCDYIAAQEKIPEWDKRRIKAAVASVMRKNTRNGNTCITFPLLLDDIKTMENRSAARYRSSALLVAEEVLTDRYHIEDGDAPGERIISTRADYEAEKNIAGCIKRLNASKRKRQTIPDSLIDSIADGCGIEYSASQRDAFKVLETPGVKVITGGPGTGKTTLVNGLVQAYLQMSGKGEGSITLCAPTGCAAMRLSEATKLPASTIHKMLKISPFIKTTAANGKIEASFVIADEASMLDVQLAAELFSALKNNTIVLLVGDADQLASIGEGNVFSDIIESGAAEVHRLETIFRQDGRDSIVKNSQKILSGDTALEEADNFKIIKYPEFPENIVSEIGKDVLSDERSMVFTPVKNSKFTYGAINLNMLIKKTRDNLRTSKDLDDEKILYGDYEYSAGDHIIFTRNNYEKGYVNGQDGVITNIQKRPFSIKISTNGDIIYFDSIKDLNDIDLSYAMTAHKAQGGETDTAVVIVPKRQASMLNVHLLYVEITRARKKVIMYVEDGALLYAARHKDRIKRKTRLKAYLQN